MLVVSRRRGEGIIIGDAEVVILEIDARRRVKIGIKAPPETLVLRAELAGDRPGKAGVESPEPTKRPEPQGPVLNYPAPQPS